MYLPLITLIYFLLSFQTAKAVCDENIIDVNIFNQSSIPDYEKVINKFQNNCNLFGEYNSEFNSSSFWGQQMTGADLVRQDLLKRKEEIKISRKDILIWDVGGSHAESVSNLITGPHSSAIIPQKYSPPHIFDWSGYKNVFENQVRSCLNNKSDCPSFINQSDDWKSSDLNYDGSEMGKLYSELNRRGTIAVISSGNDQGRTEDAKHDYSDKVLLVGAVASDGQPKSWSSQSEGVIITAPGDGLTSFEFSGEKSEFGATSAAAPQVLSALLMFNKVSGHRLTLNQAKSLLTQTALPFTNLREGEKHGAGILNAFKLYHLAKKLNNNCKEATPLCFNSRLKEPSFYQVGSKVSQKLLSETIKVFPECSKDNKALVEFKPDCKKQREILERVRKYTLLDHKNKEAWKLLSCMTTLSPYKKMNSYYSYMSEESKKPVLEEVEEEFLSENKLSRKEYEEKLSNLLKNKNTTKEQIIDLSRQAPRDLPPKHISLIKKALRFKLSWDDLKNLKIGNPILKNSSEVIDQLVDTKDTDVLEFLVYKGIKGEHWSDKEFYQWANKTLDYAGDNSRMLSGDLIKHAIFVRKNRDLKFLDRVFKEGHVDDQLATSLGPEYWISKPEKLSLLIERGKAHGIILSQIIPLLPPKERKQALKKIKANLKIKNGERELNRYLHYQ